MNYYIWAFKIKNMFIQSDDYYGFTEPIIIKTVIIKKRRFFGKYLVALLEKERQFNCVNCGVIVTSTLILEQRFPFFFVGLSKLPKEVMVLTSDYYEKNGSCKCLLGLVDLYDGMPDYKK